MGTSKAYNGRPDTGRLLPPEVQEPKTELLKSQPQEPQVARSPEEPPKPEVAFRQVRRAFNRLAEGVRSGVAISAGGGIARVARDYIRANGGSRTAAQAGPNGRIGARNLGSFLSAVAQNGLTAATQRFNIATLAGLPPDVVLVRLLDALLPNASTREDVLARHCLANALERWLDQHDVAGNGLEALERTTQAEIPDLMKLYLCQYVHDRMLNELVDWAERTGDDETAHILSEDLREYIDGKLEQHLEHYTDEFGPDAWLDHADDVAEKLFNDVFGLLEDLPVEDDDREASNQDTGEES